MAAATQDVSSKRLTRSALKKISSTAITDAGNASDDANGGEGDAGSTERLLQDYAEYKSGLKPGKRRRTSQRSRSASVASVTSVTSETDSHASQGPLAATTAIHKTDIEMIVIPPTRVASAATAIESAASEEAAAVVAVPAIAEVPLAQEEKALEGAPEGELYVVTVLASCDIHASLDVDAERVEIDQVLKAKESLVHEESEKSASSEELSWAKEYAALDSVRRLALHHTDTLTALLQETSVMTVLVCPAAMNLRSAMARNALLCIQDIVQATKRDSEPFFGVIVPLLVQRTGNEKQFIRDLARDVLLTCIEHCAHEPLLGEFLRIATAEKNAQVVSSAGIYAQKCMERMDEAELTALVTTTRGSFFDEMSAFLNCKVVDCKVATRKALQQLRKSLGGAPFTTLVKTKLEGTAQFELLKASSEQKRPTLAKSGLPKLSMRERMLQMKKQQMQQQDQPVVIETAALKIQEKPASANNEEATR